MIALLLSAALAANTARCEASHNWPDVRAVLVVALERTDVTRQPLSVVLTRPWQFAVGCKPGSRTLDPEHLRLGILAAVGGLHRPKWLRGATHFTSPYVDVPGMCARWKADEVGRVPRGHIYCRPRGTGGWTQASRASGTE